MSTIVSQIQAALESSSPIRKLSDVELARELAALKALHAVFEPERVARANEVAATEAAIASPPAATALEIAAIPLELRNRLKLRLQLCEAERTVRARVARTARTPGRPARGTNRGQSPEPRVGAASCAKDVLPATAAELLQGPIRVAPSARGNWIRLADARSGRPTQRGAG